MKETQDLDGKVETNFGDNGEQVQCKINEFSVSPHGSYLLADIGG